MTDRRHCPLTKTTHGTKNREKNEEDSTSSGRITNPIILSMQPYRRYLKINHKHTNYRFLQFKNFLAKEIAKIKSIVASGVS